MSVKGKLLSLGVKPRKERGQNFLIDPSVIYDLVNFGRPQKGDTIVEIGPGLGALTRELAHFGPLTLIEIEEQFCEELKLRYPGSKIVNQDVREVDFSEFGSNLLVFGNLPYSFSSDIVFHLVANAPCVDRAILMLQKEFVERMAATPGGKEYGALTISCQLFADVRQGPIIAGNSFHPPTKVNSRLVELVFLKEPRYPVSDFFTFRRVVSAAFFRRRKKVINSIKAMGSFTTESLMKAFDEAEISPDVRGETLGIEDFVKLTEAMLKYKLL